MNADDRGDWKKRLDSAAAGAPRVAVFGIGNDLRGDDAAGLLCLREARALFAGRPPGPAGSGRAIAFFEGGETPENETGRLRAFRPDLVVLVDAARGGRPPGTVFLVEKDRIADEELSTHRISLALLVRYLEESLGTKVIFLGIEPVSTAAGAPVSAPVRKAATALAGRLARRL